MPQVRFSRLAREDLLELWVGIALDNPASATAVLQAVESRCALLAQFPQLGRARPELANAIRSLAVGRLVVFYRLTREGVQIARVVAGMRDLTQISLE